MRRKKSKLLHKKRGKDPDPYRYTLPPARKRKEAGKTLTKRGFSSRNTTNTKGKPIWEVSGAKARRQHKDTVKASAAAGWSGPKKPSSFYEPKSLTNYTTEKLIKGSLVS